MAKRARSTALLIQLYLATQGWKRLETQRVLASKLKPYGERYPVPPQSATELLPYLTWRRQHVAESTYRGDWQALSRFHTWAEGAHRLPNPFEGMPGPRKPKTVPQRIEDHEVAAVWRFAVASGNPEWLALAMLLPGCGPRIGEVAAMRRSHILKDYIIIPGGKSGQREIPIPHPSFHDVIARLGSGDLLWVFEGRPRSVKGLTNTWRMLCGHAGVTGRRAGPHASRHWFAVKILEASGDIRLVQWLLGHENISSTTIYLKLIQAQNVIPRWPAISPLRGLAA